MNAEWTTDTVLMLRPNHFGFNETTSASNVFQKRSPHLTPEEIHRRALSEFDRLTALLKREGVHLLIVDDKDEPRLPDAVFPNNWFSTHPDGTIVLYPMEGENRRLERREDIVRLLKDEHRFRRVIDMTQHEKEGRYLEGTGSMVFDRRNSAVYACVSSRTDTLVLRDLAGRMNLSQVISFTANVKTNEETGFDVLHPIYHTNVMMSLGATTAVVCAEVIRSDAERGMVLSALWSSGYEVVEISADQIHRFAGNMLQIRTGRGDLLWVMSSQAFGSLTPSQKHRLTADGSRIVHAPLDTIELVGGGSARCMMAEIFHPGTR